MHRFPVPSIDAGYVVRGSRDCSEGYKSISTMMLETDGFFVLERRLGSESGLLNAVSAMLRGCKGCFHFIGPPRCRLCAEDRENVSNLSIFVNG